MANHGGLYAQGLSLGVAVGKDLVITNLYNAVRSDIQSRGFQVEEHQRAGQMQVQNGYELRININH